jgi:N-formylglutamate amidohydrolase
MRSYSSVKVVPMQNICWEFSRGEGPLVAAAIHNGHGIRRELTPYLAIAEAERLREEDPFTGAWTRCAPTRVVGLQSRFEVDLNRPREKAVYRKPEDAWGLGVWREIPPDEVLARSYGLYDAFYAEMEERLRERIEQHGRIVILDLHSYNHRRGGPAAEPADPDGNPEVNVGTSNMELGRWGPVVDCFEETMRAGEFRGRPFDVRRNVRFQGGNFVQWIHHTFPGSACALAIEIKKFFMDEWTGELDEEAHAAVGRQLKAAGEAVLRLV